LVLFFCYSNVLKNLRIKVGSGLEEWRDKGEFSEIVSRSVNEYGNIVAESEEINRVIK